jgi:hypothetical protein
LCGTLEQYESNTIRYFHQVHPDTNTICEGHCFIIDTQLYKEIGIDTDYILCCEDWDFRTKMGRKFGAGAVVLWDSSTPFIYHKTCFIRKDNEGHITGPIEVKDRETFDRKWNRK